MRIKIHPITAILSSAYLSAMLTSSVAPIQSDATLAAAVDPAAAQKAFQGAISGLDAAGWAAAVQTPVVTIPAPSPVPPAPRATVTDPAMTEELMARLIKRTLRSKIPTTMPDEIVKIFGLSDGTTKIPVLQIKEDVPGGRHYCTISTQPGSDDIILTYRKAGVRYGEVYLTDESRVLRAAAFFDDNGLRLLTNEQAAEMYRAELRWFADFAKGLPPADPGNS